MKLIVNIYLFAQFENMIGFDMIIIGSTAAWE